MGGKNKERAHFHVGGLQSFMYYYTCTSVFFIQGAAA